MAYLAELAAHGDRVTLVPQDEAGLLDIGRDPRAPPSPDTLVYCCGPEPLLAVGRGSTARSWPTGVAAPRALRREGGRSATAQDASFELVLQRSGLSVTVPADQTVFDAMRDAGVPVLGSCLEGICGTCETGVLEGEVEHRDSVLDADEQEAMDCMMVCVSRCRGARLVLDA